MGKCLVIATTSQLLGPVASVLIALCASAAVAGDHIAGDQVVEKHTMQSNPPLRPLHEPSDRPMADGPRYFVDPALGDDQTPDGSEQQPGRTINLAVGQIVPDDKGGVDGEFRSVNRYPNICELVGNFGDAMVGLITCWHAMDLRSDEQSTGEDRRPWRHVFILEPGVHHAPN